MEPDDLLEPVLSDDQRRLLVAGLSEWRGPARPTQELAVAMGFRDIDDLNDSGFRIQQAIEGQAAVRRLDWLRALLAAEICFSSNLLGAGLDWMFTTGLSDEDSIHLLRDVQIILGPEVRHLIGRDLGTLPEPG